jgi:hypothetical protein
MENRIDMEASNIKMINNYNCVGAELAQWYSAGLRADDRGFEFRLGLGNFLLTTAVSRPNLGPTQPPIQWVAGTFSVGLNRSGREADHSPPRSKNAWSYNSTPPIWLHGFGAHLNHRDKFTFTLFLFYYSRSKGKFIPVLN